MQSQSRSIDEARLSANISARAARLFEDGYSIVRKSEDTLVVTSNEGTKYEVDTFWGSCECPCYKHHGHCKHLEGWKSLLEAQTEYEAHLLKGYDESKDYGRAVMEESLYRRLANGAAV